MRITLLLLFLSFINAQIALPTFQAVHKPHTAEASSLYDFTSHTFTNCGATGTTGPTLANCKSSYDTSWEDDTDFFNVQTQGFQEWTVPASGTYSFVLKGASGGGGLPNCNCSSLTSGGGGGSYDSTSNATISLLSSSGHGQVIITLN